MNGTMILFQFTERTDHNTVNKFMQKFYGQDSTSWNGKYKYHGHGFMENIPHRKLLRGVMILRNEDVANVLNFLEQYSLTLHVREVKLTSVDEKILRGTHE
ncbi:MAG: hypothetical protein AMDU4_FER2C00092G0008 [Ferroplasma sp. Type II]|jgi:hypothetical protein|uniref:hypothetical protein n=1 Tax=Ferroplasma sp. Type II TaxID=261388 RepID=UPI00038962C0|nr:hypothetical protein [Ferroplasma sp. Type II]EQB73180.1 MAG: hypothetical protein AMDU4_FER2C00092G0008 [Ferroplasma sp. Type II]